MLPYSNENYSPYDLNTYWGRFQHFLRKSNPLNIFVTGNQLKDYQEILKNHASSKKSDKDLWNMRYKIDSNLHPQTKEFVPILFRMSTFVPVNVPITMGMAILPPTPFNQFVFQSLNQGYNFFFNYCNRNMSNIYSYPELLGSLFGAVSFAIACSVGIPKLIRRLALPNFFKTIIIGLSPWLGVVTANSFNLSFSRYQDFFNGIKVINPETNQEIEGMRSFVAARKAFFSTWLTRITIPIPIFLVPALSIRALTALRMYPAGGPKKILIDSIIAAVALQAGLSFCIALFPEIEQIKASQLEPQFQKLTDSKGKPFEYFKYNKGI